MFSKNNLKYILIIALGFFWCSSLYLTQEQYLASFADTDFVNIVELLFGSLSMALGILTFGLLYKKNKNIKLLYLIFMVLSIVCMITSLATNNIYLISICMCLNCFLGTAGFGAGYHFSLLSENVLKEHRGRVFAIGYGLGSIGTYLMILTPVSIYATINSLFLYIPALVINMVLVFNKTNLKEIKKEKYSKDCKSFFIKMSFLVVVMALLSALSTDAIAIHTINIAGGYGATRIYYSLGLLIAGFLVDKKNSIFEVLTIVSFIFGLLAIILLKDGFSINIIAALSYFFVAFFVLFRTMSFVNLKSNFVWAAGFGLMYSRIMEGIMVLFEDSLLENYTLLIIVISIMLSIVIILYFLMYYNKDEDTVDVKIKDVVIKFGLSNQEEKVLLRLVDGKSNQEISEDLYISIFTVKRHIANIYQKTGMNKKLLKETCYNK